MASRTLIWCEVVPGLAINGVDLGPSFWPGMRRVIVRDFDGRCHKMTVVAGSCITRLKETRP